MESKKQAILAALRAFAEQRPGLDRRDYGDWRSYCAEQRKITKDLADARTLLAYVSGQDAITADMILNEDPGGRLTIMGIYTDESKGPHSAKNTGGDFTTYVVDYCVAGYWPVEYRRAVCRLLSLVLWAHVREHLYPQYCAGWRASSKDEPPNAGDRLRAHFKREFGRRIASRYFD